MCERLDFTRTMYVMSCIRQLVAEAIAVLCRGLFVILHESAICLLLCVCLILVVLTSVISHVFLHRGKPIVYSI